MNDKGTLSTSYDPLHLTYLLTYLHLQHSHVSRTRLATTHVSRTRLATTHCIEYVGVQAHLQHSHVSRTRLATTHCIEYVGVQAHLQHSHVSRTRLATTHCIEYVGVQAHLQHSYVSRTRLLVTHLTDENKTPSLVSPSKLLRRMDRGQSASTTTRTAPVNGELGNGKVGNR